MLRPTTSMLVILVVIVCIAVLSCASDEDLKAQSTQTAQSLLSLQSAATVTARLFAEEQSRFQELNIKRAIEIVDLENQLETLKSEPTPTTMPVWEYVRYYEVFKGDELHDDCVKHNRANDCGVYEIKKRGFLSLRNTKMITSVVSPCWKNAKVGATVPDECSP